MDNSENKKLTPKQNSVMYLLQNGWELITDMEMSGALVCSSKYQFRINNGLFFRLVEMGLIFQAGARDHFSYILTPKGKTIKTKPVSIDGMGLEELPIYKDGVEVSKSVKEEVEPKSEPEITSEPIPESEINKVTETQAFSYNDLYDAICDLSKSLSDEVIKINNGILKGDTGLLDMKTDPMQTKSFSRGKTVGLVIARDRADKIIQNNKKTESPWTILELKEGKYTNAPEPEKPVVAILQWSSGKQVPAIIKYGNWDDHSWRTVDDDSELSYSLDVIKWMYLPE
jgi:hypothetical protein